MRTKALSAIAPLCEKRAVAAGALAMSLAAGFGVFYGLAELHAAEEDPVTAALESLDDYMAAFNARDPQAWAATLNYPHVRIASGAVRVWETEEEYTAYMDFDAFAERTGWHHSEWDRRDVLQSGPDKVHLATTFSRYNAQGEKIATYDSLYVVTKVDGHWRTQARSSFAP